MTRINWEIRRQTVWTRIREMREFTLHHLSRDLGLCPDTVDDQVQALVKSGHLRHLPQRGPGRKAFGGRYVLARDTGVQVPEITGQGMQKPASAQQRIWAAIKVLKKFCIDEIMMAATVTRYQAMSYCRHLVRAGYLITRRNGRSAQLYVLLPGKHSGPRCPVISNGGSVFDRNRNEFAWQPAQAGAS